MPDELRRVPSGGGVRYFNMMLPFLGWPRVRHWHGQNVVQLVPVSHRLHIGRETTSTRYNADLELDRSLFFYLPPALTLVSLCFNKHTSAMTRNNLASVPSSDHNYYVAWIRYAAGFLQVSARTKPTESTVVFIWYQIKSKDLP